MTNERGRNVAASIRQRLLNLSRSRNEDFNLVLSQYAVERLLFRLSSSAHRDRFTLKGALLFLVWGGDMHRATRDADLLGTGSSDPADLRRVFVEILSVEVEDDGLRFDPASLQAEPIKPASRVESRGRYRA